MKKNLILLCLFLISANELLKAQCVAGTSIISWQTATTGSATIIPGGAPAGGPPSTITDAAVGCSSAFNFTVNISDPNGVYDKIRSSTSGTTIGTYGTPYFTIYMDNLDGGCGTGAYVNPSGGCTNLQNAPYAAGNKIIITFTFDKAVLMNGFRIDDIDASDVSNPPTGSSSFQDRVVFSATDVNGNNVPVTLSVGAAGRVTIAGQTATAGWVAATDRNVSPDDPLGQVTANTTAPIKSFTMEYVAGPNEPNPAQQAIRLGQFSICCPVIVNLSGNVFNDLNGLNNTNVDGTGIGLPSSVQLYANLTDPVSGKVVAVVPVAANGTYSFTGITGQTNYNVVLSTTQGVAGNPAPSPSLPSNWVNAGEDCCDNTGSDGTVNGIVSVSVGTANVTNANFGIEQLPNTNTSADPAQPNPGGTNNYTIPAASWGGTDPDGGIISSIKITVFPSNATTITINGTTYTSATFPVGGVTVPTNASGQPTQTIAVNPPDGNVSVVIPYAAIDNAGKQDATPGSLTIPFNAVNLSGTVYNDVNGLNAGGNVDGAGIGLPSGTQLYANLLNAAGTTVIATVPVNANGTYSFNSIAPNTNYTVQVSTNQGTVGGATPVTALPANWVNTGEDCCDNTGSDGTVNGLVSVTVAAASVVNANFGIEQLPNSGVNVQPSQLLPGGTTQVTVPSTAFSGTDNDGGIISSIRITAFPADATTIVINGTSYTNATFPVGGVTIPANAAGQPTQTITVDPQNGGSRAVVIPYVTIDNAGKEDPTPGSVTMPFDNTDWTVAGNVFNDLNALTDGNVNGAGVGLPAGTQLYAYLRTGASATVLQAVPVNSNGTYSFPEVTNGNYTVVVSTTVVAVGGTTPAVVLPANWVLTGEDCCDNTGSDGTVNGTTNFTMASANVSNVNFGIEQLPNSNIITQPVQTNPGGTVSVAVPAASFGATDPDGGTVTAIRITSFPANATSITINGVTYTTLAAINTAYPNGITTNAGGQPTVPVTVDPVDGNVNVVINYAAIDNAGREDATPGSVTLPFATINISGNVYNDLNGLTDATVNGTGINTPSGVQLHANLLDAAGNVVATVPVGAGGAYAFNNVPGSTTYTIQISTNAGTATQPAPADALPANWVSTGENLGTGAGNDGTVNTRLPITVGSTDITNANFGIEQLPESGTVTLATVPNPGGTSNYTIPASSFSGTDPDAGTITSIRITAFPANAASVTINGITYTAATFPAAGVTIPANAAGEPTQTISVDPVDGTVTVSIPYAAIDNAGKEDATPGVVTIPFSSLAINGNVFDDGNGLNGGGNVDGSGIGLPAGTQLYANLLDAAGTTVIATVPVNADGTYSFYGVSSNTNYVVQVTTNQGTVGSAVPATALPSNWVNAGEDCCDNTGSDGTVNGLIAVAVTTADVNNANFGINKLPESNDIVAPSQINPGGTIQVTVPALSGTDQEDGAMGAGKTIRVDVLPPNAMIYYNGVLVTAGTPIANYNPALLTIDPDPNGPTQPYQLVNFQYSFQDAAGNWDAVPNTVTMEFLEPVAIKGTVYNDVNGSANNTHQTIQDGIEQGTDAYGQLFAYVITAPGGANTVTQKVPVNADGTWAFSGLAPIGNVRVIISSTNVAVGAAAPALTLPADWANTSPLDTFISYNNPPGFLITDVNFGVEQLPESFNNTQPSQTNPGGTTSVLIPSFAFGGEDVSVGIVSSIRVTDFPTNTTSITINGVTYLAPDPVWPANGGTGVLVPTDAFGQPLQTVSVDPVDGGISVVIPFVTVDNAGRPDPTPAFVTLPFLSTLPVRSISLSGNLHNSLVTLNWSTINEEDITGFELQRSNDGLNFVSVDRASSKGNGNHTYAATDDLKTFNGKAVYYRIRAVDVNGKYAYSASIRISLSNIKEIVIRPNPFVSHINLQITVQKISNGAVRIYAEDGKIVYTRTVQLSEGLNSIIIDDLQQLPAGTYLIELNFNGVRKTEKLIKTK